ncbi:MAG TPA: VanZ family protein [Polyangiaceae bacterium LLY-WYZ-15_(1-7)]|nr:hypothetical protein [Myxococcales bacterium]MAT25539.1 hypothetical protein [Sandaracinus sp.]HJK90044.1 VanZ family protein [Polyangiaceae bacterium LLY-WYZ-15_(1-7)]MBJ69987.1 hypothetical protein [Sandaracinus sp.]HJL03977.1 VanZ family protein [Polyangiaceae bacterium LLY-WYZ-15_(1-7)]
MWVHWLPAFAYMALIFAVSSIAVVAPMIDSFPLKDKGVHFLEYAVLGFLCAHAALRTWPDRAPLRTLALGAFLATAWGLSDELHQAFVPGRSAEVADLVADAIGALAGAGLRGVVRQFATRRAPRPQQETSS